MQQSGQKRIPGVKEGRESSLREIQTSLGRTTWSRPCRGRRGWHWQDAVQGVPLRDRGGQRGSRSRRSRMLRVWRARKEGKPPTLSGPVSLESQEVSSGPVSLESQEVSSGKPHHRDSHGLEQGRSLWEAEARSRPQRRRQARCRASAGAWWRSLSAQPAEAPATPLCAPTLGGRLRQAALRGTAVGRPGSRGDPRPRPHPSLQSPSGRRGPPDRNSSLEVSECLSEEQPARQAAERGKRK